MDSYAVSLIASCAMHPAGRSPILTLEMAYSSISPSSESLQRNLWRCISRSSNQTELYILLMSLSAACTPLLNLSSTAQIGLRTSGPFSRRSFMLTPLNCWLVFHTRRTGAVTECEFGATRWLTYHTGPLQLAIIS